MPAKPDARYLASRLLQAVFVLWATFTVSFMVLYVLPGDPARLILGGAGGGGAPTRQQLDVVNAEYGFDLPLHEQYLRYVTHALRGDFGSSYGTHDAVTHMIGQALPSTVALTAFSLLLAVVIGTAVGTLSVYSTSRGLSRLLDSVPALSVSLPTFWTGMLLIQLLSFDLRLLPAAGDSGVQTLLMPGLCMALPAGALIAQLLSRSLHAAVREPYTDIARAKGATKQRVFFRHAFRNALIPVVTVSGMIVANLFAYSAITETVFSRNGVGYLLQSAVKTKDIPVVLAVVLLISVVYVLVNLAVDLLYPLLDPRITLGRRISARPARVREAV
ncbi:ABC transporter permease [Streptomyces umbrinus]|uniref:ABC transporter permease n=1 Tax=Streptomyces umbrinus TaxID=67370 RepID=UPI003C2C57F1